MVILNSDLYNTWVVDISQPERCAWCNFKNSRPEVFCKKGVLKNSQIQRKKAVSEATPVQA